MDIRAPTSSETTGGMEGAGGDGNVIPTPTHQAPTTCREMCPALLAVSPRLGTSLLHSLRPPLPPAFLPLALLPANHKPRDYWDRNVPSRC